MNRFVLWIVALVAAMMVFTQASAAEFRNDGSVKFTVDTQLTMSCANTPYAIARTSVVVIDVCASEVPEDGGLKVWVVKADAPMVRFIEAMIREYVGTYSYIIFDISGRPEYTGIPLRNLALSSGSVQIPSETIQLASGEWMTVIYLPMKVNGDHERHLAIAWSPNVQFWFHSTFKWNTAGDGNATAPVVAQTREFLSHFTLLPQQVSEN